MKIIHTADWHLGKNIEGHSRLPEQELFLKDFVRICEQEEADLILIAGDIYDSYNPPAMAEQLFYDTLKQLSRDGACMTVIISGNHDAPERLTASGPLARDHGIVMAGTPNTIIPTGQYGQNVITESGPGYIHAVIHGEKADLLLVPFPSEKRLAEIYLDETQEDSQKAESYGQRIHTLFAQLSEHFKPDAVHLIISHLFVMNSMEDGSERSIQLGGSYLVGSEVFPENADYIALGHVHKPQKVPECARARYSGSPLHYNQREISFENQILSINVHPGLPCEIKEIPLPIYKPIEIWKCENVEEALSRCEENKNRDCWVYMEIKTDHYIHEEDIKAMKKRKADILSIRPIFPDSTENSPGLHEPEEQPFDVLVKDFYRRKFHVDMEEETLELLMEIVNEHP
ncbi:MAG: exonuclease SbcCD subunit D [Lachnospiraceae bacterium]|nr:exonuclease SbcCD subunit D [Lachnospiraceae bacterium]